MLHTADWLLVRRKWRPPCPSSRRRLTHSHNRPSDLIGLLSSQRSVVVVPRRRLRSGCLCCVARRSSKRSRRIITLLSPVPPLYTFPLEKQCFPMYRDAYERYGQERNRLDVGGVRADAST
jgi:hypothetical protein